MYVLDLNHAAPGGHDRRGHMRAFLRDIYLALTKLTSGFGQAEWLIILIVVVVLGYILLRGHGALAR